MTGYLQYLVHCGADLGILSVERKKTEDIAIVMKKCTEVVYRTSTIIDDSFHVCM